MNIKRFRLLLFVLLAGGILAGTASPAQAQLGIAGGLNFESIDDIQTESNNAAKANFESSTGYHIGVIYELGIGPLSIRPGFLYRRVGEFDLSGVDDNLQNPTYSVTAWEVPIDVRVPFFSVSVLSAHVVGGPKATILRGEEEFDKVVNDLSYTLNIGIGAQIAVPATSLRLQPEIRYEFGASGFIDKGQTVDLPGENGDVSFTPQDSPNFSAFAVRLNVLF